MKKFEAEGRLIYYDEFGDHVKLTLDRTNLIDALARKFRAKPTEDQSSFKLDFGKVRITVERLEE